MYVKTTYVISLRFPLKGDDIQAASNTLVRLASSGLGIEPGDWQNIVVSDGWGSVEWTLRTSEPGDYPLAIALKGVDAKVRLFPIAETPVVAHLSRRISDYVETYWPYVSAFFGAFLTLPGIVSFWQNSQKGRSKPAPPAHPGYIGEVTLPKRPDSTQGKPKKRLP